jgi:hypothetical protein
MPEDWDFFIDHEAVYDCDPYDVESYHAAHASVSLE